MGIIFGSARIDENGNISGGKAGDQTGQEVSTQSYYMHSRGWYCLRPKSVDVANKIATAMQQACDNNNIGYDQSQRTTVWNALKQYGSLKNIAVPCEGDCSLLIRCCVYQATGKDVGNFDTSAEAGVLEGSGLFEKRFSVSSSSQLYNGDVLVTKSKGHTVVVVSGRPRNSSNNSTNSNPTGSWKATGTATCTGSDVNYRSGAGTNYTSYGKLGKGNRFEVDGQKQNGWVHINVNGTIAWISEQYVKYDSGTTQNQTPPKVNVQSGNQNVRDGQTHCNNYVNAKIQVDGIYGAKSKEAGTKCFQQAMNMDYGLKLAIDGKFGTNSKNALNGHTVRKGETQELVRALQINLLLNNYNPNGVDGIFGSGCESAVRQFQKDHELTVDGIAGYNTITRMCNCV